MAEEIATGETARLMDAVYRNQRHIYDLTRKYYLLGRDRLIDRLQPAAGERVLEVGCGTGRNLIAAARRYPEARFFGFDISAEMLETARANVARAGLSDRICLVRGDASDPLVLRNFTAAPEVAEGFDRVFFSYTLSMIPVWRQAIAVGAGALKPGGRLSVVDFGEQERLPRSFRTLLLAWLRAFHVTPRSELVAELQGVAEATGRALDVATLYRGYALYAELGPAYSPATK